MNHPCDTCAFRPGSVTHDKEIDNQFRGRIAALSGSPFYCHEGLNYKSHPFRFIGGMVIDGDGNFARVKVCAGWKAEVVKHVKPSTPDRKARRRLGSEVLEIFDAALDETRKPERKELWAELRRLFFKLTDMAGIDRELKPGFNRVKTP